MARDDEYPFFQLTPEQADGIRSVLDEFYARLPKSLSKQLTDVLAPVQRKISETVAARLRNLTPTIGPVVEVYRATLPTNWKGFESATEIGRIFDLMQATGWCLVWVPREDIVREILDQDEASQSLVLLSHRDAIADDIQHLLGKIEDPELAAYRHSANRALAAYGDGHFEAAQALAATTLSALLNSHLGYTSFARARKELKADPWEHGVRTFRRAAVFNQVALSLQGYFADRGDDVPKTFSRHATAHAVSPEQFTEENSIASLLLLAGFIRELEALKQA